MTTKTLTLVEADDPILRKVAYPVNYASHERAEILELVENMLDLLKDKEGSVGLAAPQVGVSKRCFVMDTPSTDVLVVINPKIVRHGRDEVSLVESCLSLPGVRKMVTRWRVIDVEFLTPHKGTIKRTLKGFPARIFQHEYDHLEGKLIG